MEELFLNWELQVATNAEAYEQVKKNREVLRSTATLMRMSGSLTDEQVKILDTYFPVRTRQRKVAEVSA